MLAWTETEVISIGRIRVTCDSMWKGYHADEGHDWQWQTAKMMLYVLRHNVFTKRTTDEVKRVRRSEIFGSLGGFYDSDNCDYFTRSNKSNNI